MVTRNKFALWIAAGLGFALIALVVSTVLLLKLSNLPPIRKKILATVSKEFGGRVRSQETAVKLLPEPEVIIREGSLKIPGKPSIIFHSLAIHIDILPLFIGRIQTSELELLEPQFTFSIPPPAGSGPHSGPGFSVATLKKNISDFLTPLGRRAPNLRLVVEKGVLTLQEQERTVFRFHDLAAQIQLPPKNFQVAVSCGTNFCQRLRLEARLQPDSDNGRGSLQCEGLQPRYITDFFLPRASLQVLQGTVNLDLKFHTEGLRTLQVALQGSIPALKLQRHNQQLSFTAKDLAASVALGPERLKASFTQLDLTAPKLQASADFEWAWKPQKLRLKILGKAVDVAATRRAALFLLGEHDIVQKIFEIVRGGQVPAISFTSQGNSWHDLGEKSNFVLKGSLVHGEIFVPKADLDLQDVHGETMIADGILAGKDLSAQLGNSTGEQGIMRLGLEKHNAPFHLDIMVDADLAQLPPLLVRLVKNKRLHKEFKMIKSAEGTARGRLILGETLDHIEVHTQVSRFHLRAVYARVPYPITIQGGQFHFAPDRITAGNLQVDSDHCSFSQLSFMIDWAKTARIKAEFKQAQLSLNEFYPWLLSFKDISRTLKDFHAMQGQVKIDGLHLHGPLAHPRQWQYSGSGTLRNYTLKAAFLPGPLTLKSGAFQGATRKLSLTDTKGTILDAKISGSGSLDGYLYDLQGADLKFAGTVGPRALAWLDTATHLPDDLKMKPPLSVSTAHFSWKRDTRMTFKGDFTVPDGPRIGLDLVHTPAQLNVNRLSIQDQSSHADLTFRLDPQSFDVGFKGNLAHTTLDRLLTHNRFLEGWLKGNLQAHILLDQPMDSVAQGSLQGAGLEYPRKTEMPVQLEQFSCTAEQHKVAVQSAILNWNGKQMNLQGNLKFSPHGFVFDMGLTADSLDWDQIQKDIVGTDWIQHTNGHSKSFWDLPVHGVLRVQAKRFSYRNLTWSPCDANIFWGAKQVNVVIMKAELCNISTLGVIRIRPGQTRFHILPTAKNQSVSAALTCLFNKKRLMNGQFDLHSELTATGEPKALSQSLSGNLDFTAHEGRIFRFNILAKIFSVLNFTDIFVGRLPDLTKDGLGYRSITIKGDIQKGKLVLREAVIDGDSIEIASQGSVDLVHKTLDMTVLVAPLKTVDIILSYIPFLGDLIGKIISIPVQVTGSLDDPTVIPLSPTAVGSDLLGIMKSAIGLPLKIIQPILPK